MITPWGPSSWPLRRCSKRFQEWCKDSKVFSKMKKTNFKSSSTSSKAYTTLNSLISSSSSFKRVEDLPKQLKVKNQRRRQYSLRNWTICIWKPSRDKRTPMNKSKPPSNKLAPNSLSNHRQTSTTSTPTAWAPRENSNSKRKRRTTSSLDNYTKT